MVRREEMRAMQDAWRAYLDLALGLTETSRKKATKLARKAVAKKTVAKKAVASKAVPSKAVPSKAVAKKVAGPVQPAAQVVPEVAEVVAAAAGDTAPSPVPAKKVTAAKKATPVAKKA